MTGDTIAQVSMAAADKPSTGAEMDTIPFQEDESDGMGAVAMVSWSSGGDPSDIKHP